MQCVSPYIKKDKFGIKQVLPCGHCVTCKIQRRREWTIRLLNELDYWKDAAFITLTYDEQHLGVNSLDKKDIQTYIKNTRKEFDKKLKFYLCGEYGSQKHRKHWHIILFGVAPNDERIKKHWNKGFICVGDVNHDSIQYVAGYVQKKLYGKYAEYEKNGQIPPFLFSRKVLVSVLRLITRNKYFESWKLGTRVKVMACLDTIARFSELIMLIIFLCCDLKKKENKKILTDCQNWVYH